MRLVALHARSEFNHQTVLKKEFRGSIFSPIMIPVDGWQIEKSPKSMDKLRESA